MTHRKNRGRRSCMTAAAATIAALALAGCSATHVGDAWQCPLAQGAACESVAAADPAVPAMGEQDPVLRDPLYRVRGADDAGAADEASVPVRPCDADCAGFDPFAWLARLFAAEGDGEIERPDDTPSADEMALPAGPAATSSTPPPTPESQHADPVPDSDAPGGEVPTPDLAVAEPAALPAEPDPADLRTGEVVARIWIAPFVDADGVYREASHVRVVLEPAAWRLR